MSKLLSFTAVIIFTIYSITSVFFKTLPVIVPTFYLVISIFTFILYAIDKSAAINGRWRTKESTLHLFALAGGWPGALFAQQMLRHKSSKQTFISILWITIALNLGGFMWLHTAEGSSFLYSHIHNIDMQFTSLIAGISLPDFVQVWLWKLDYYGNKQSY